MLFPLGGMQSRICSSGFWLQSLTRSLTMLDTTVSNLALQEYEVIKSLFLTALLLLLLPPVSFPLFAAQTPQKSCSHSYSPSPAPIPSAKLCSQALGPQSPPQRSKVANDTMSHVSSKSTHEPPVMLALGSSLPPVLTLLTCPPGSTPLELSSPYSLFARTDLGLCPRISPASTTPS